MTEDFYTIREIAEALNSSQSQVSALLKDTPFKLRKSTTNYKMQRVYHKDIIMPLCVKWKRQRSIPDGWLTVAAAAEKYRVSSSHILTLSTRGLIASKKRVFGKIIHEADLERVLNDEPEIAKARRVLNRAVYHLNNLKHALENDKKSPLLIDDEAKATMREYRDLLISKLQELSI